MGTVYLIPTFLAPDGMAALPAYIINALQQCQVIFAENERSTRRYLKALSKDFLIEDFEWFTIHKAEDEEVNNFLQCLKQDKNIAIISEAGCPGIADPGQILVAKAQEAGAVVKPLVGPSSILLALMASGLNGQNFEFVGYLPIDQNERATKLKMLEADSRKNNSTKIFIETPYRNMQLIQAVVQACNPSASFCIAADLTSADEYIVTKKLGQWKNNFPELHKKPVIFLLHAG